MDTLSKILSALNFDSSFYYSIQLRGTWGITVPKFHDVARFHICCAGQCWFQISGVDELIELLPGDMLIIPHGAEHNLLDNPDSKIMSLDDAYQHSHYDGSRVFKYNALDGQGYSDILCGHFEFCSELKHPFVQQLPPYILLKRPQSDEFKWLREALLNHTKEEAQSKAGNHSIINRLSEIVFTLAVQQWQEENQQSDGFLAAISDPYLSKTLDAFHNNSEQQWTA